MVLALVFMSASCAPKASQGPVRDLLDLPQNLAAYLDSTTANQPIFSPQVRQQQAAAYLKNHFAPWERSKPLHSKKGLFWGFAKYQARLTYGENYRPHPSWWVYKLAQLADPGDYPNRLVPAITTQHTSMRVLPTIEPIFSDPTKPGEGFPFDYNQNSLVWAGTPLFVVQASANGAWLLCESRFAGGWIPSRDVAMVDQAFMDQYKSGSLLAITVENVPLQEKSGQFLVQARLGMILPLLKSGNEHTVLMPVRDLDGRALLVRSQLPARAGAPFPLIATQGNIAALGNRMLGQPYGWGGLLERRDCSSTLMDLFTPFGIYLPRNSRSQAQVGEVVDVSGSSSAKKKALLLSMEPLTTLVGKRGHIMLYVGSRNNEPLIYHTIWGIRTTSNEPLPGRRIIGLTAITTLEPGRELPDLAPGSLLLESISSFSRLAPLSPARETTGKLETSP